MKKSDVLKVLTVLPILSETISMLFLPAQIPVHYSMDLQVTAHGSKFMLLFLGGIALCLGVFINFIYKAYRNTESEKIVYRLGMIALIVFNVINVLSIFGAFVL